MKWQYTKGLHEIGDGNYAWLQPDGSWGWSNADRIYVKVNNLYQELSGDTSAPDLVKLFGLMAHYEERMRRLHGGT